MLDSALKASNKLSAVNSTKTQIYSSLTGTIHDRIEFENASMTDEARKKEINIYVIKWNNGRKMVLLIL